jgi:hypothetical protein
MVVEEEPVRQEKKSSQEESVQAGGR